jgi:hypothetical protein
MMTAVLSNYLCFCSYDTWLTDVDIDAESEPPLEPDGPWQVCYCMKIILFIFRAGRITAL